MRLGLNYEELIFFDLETTGTEHWKRQITQIGAIHVPSNEKFECKVQFDMSKADKKALKINGYNKKGWIDALTQEQACHEFKRFCQNHKTVHKKSKKGNVYSIAALAGYNVSAFDKFFITDLFSQFDVFAPFDFRMYDCYELAKWFIPYLESYKLEDINKEFGLQERKAHDALEDVEMTIDVTSCLLEYMIDQPEFVMPQWAIDRLKQIDGE